MTKTLDDIELNPVDRIIDFVNPRWGNERRLERYKSALTDSHVRRFEGATRKDRYRFWNAGDGSPNYAYEQAYETILSRSRFLFSNNSWAARAKFVLLITILGDGIFDEIKDTDENLKQKVQEGWRKLVNSSVIDADEEGDLYCLKSMILDAVIEGGEIFVVKRLKKVMEGNKPKLAFELQLIETDQVPMDYKEDVSGGGKIINGIEYDVNGKRVAYHIFRQHPTESDSPLFPGTDTVRIPAEDVHHIYDKKRAGRRRGIPWIATNILNIRDLDEYEDAELNRQKIASCFALAIETDDVQGYSANVRSAAEKDKLINPSENPAGLPDRLVNGMIEVFKPGYRVNAINPPSKEHYPEYVVQILRKIAAGFGIPFELLTGDWSNVNFSSGRLGWLQFHKQLKMWRRKLFISTFLPKLWDWYLETYSFNEDIPLERLRKIKIKWTEPQRDLTDPQKEINALNAAVRNGFMSPRQAALVMGRDFNELTDEYQEDLKILDEKGIVIDTDARQVSKAGQAQAEKIDSDDKDADEDAEEDSK